jgi:hypothetical protein
MQTDTKTSTPAGDADTRVTKLEVPLTERAALTPREFAGQFGRSQTWAYRLIYAGTVRVIRPAGSLLIPRSEVGRLLNAAKLYIA